MTKSSTPQTDTGLLPSVANGQRRRFRRRQHIWLPVGAGEQFTEVIESTELLPGDNYTLIARVAIIIDPNTLREVDVDTEYLNLYFGKPAD